MLVLSSEIDYNKTNKEEQYRERILNGTKE